MTLLRSGYARTLSYALILFSRTVLNGANATEVYLVVDVDGELLEDDVVEALKATFGYLGFLRPLL
jgi:hypothetical protein